MVMQLDPLNHSDRYKISKIQDGGGGHLKNRKLTYLRHGLSNFDKIWHSGAVRLNCNLSEHPGAFIASNVGASSMPCQDVRGYYFVAQ